MANRIRRQQQRQQPPNTTGPFVLMLRGGLDGFNPRRFQPSQIAGLAGACQQLQP
jgi:hypothetical protein